MPPRKVFVSYSHRQEDWVVDRLVPVLKAGGAEVLIDREIFGAGRSVLGQMDETQDRVEVHLLVLSPDYVASGPCQHEMKRAVALDPKFEKGIVVPVLRVAVPVPARLSGALYADLLDDGKTAGWDLVLRAVEADLGADAPAWLGARDEVQRLLVRGQSVNLVVEGKAKWRPLINDLQRGDLSDLAVVDLGRPAAAARHGLVQEILAAFGASMPVPPEPQDLVVLDRFFAEREAGRLALIHFDFSEGRDTYGVDFFASLRFLTMDARKLTLLIQSRRQFVTLLPAGHPLSEIGIQTVELRGVR